MYSMTLLHEYFETITKKSGTFVSPRTFAVVTSRSREIITSGKGQIRLALYDSAKMEILL